MDGRQHINEHFLKKEAVFCPETVTIYQTAQCCNTEDHSAMEKSSGIEVNFTLMLEDLYSSETSVAIYHTSWCYNPVMIFACVSLYVVLSPM